MRYLQMPRFWASLISRLREKWHKQIERAEYVDSTADHYQQIEYGHVNIPSIMLETLADFFGVSTDYLLGRTDIRETPGKSTAPM